LFGCEFPQLIELVPVLLLGRAHSAVDSNFHHSLFADRGINRPIVSTVVFGRNPLKLRSRFWQRLLIHAARDARRDRRTPRQRAYCVAPNLQGEHPGDRMPAVQRRPALSYEPKRGSPPTARSVTAPAVCQRSKPEFVGSRADMQR
jgi:hypothetical protein